MVKKLCHAMRMTNNGRLLLPVVHASLAEGSDCCLGIRHNVFACAGKKCASKTSCHQLAGGVPGSGAIVKVEPTECVEQNFLIAIVAMKVRAAVWRHIAHTNLSLAFCEASAATSAAVQSECSVVYCVLHFPWYQGLTHVT